MTFITTADYVVRPLTPNKHRPDHQQSCIIKISIRLKEYRLLIVTLLNEISLFNNTVQKLSSFAARLNEYLRQPIVYNYTILLVVHKIIFIVFKLVY